MKRVWFYLIVGAACQVRAGGPVPIDQAAIQNNPLILTSNTRYVVTENLDLALTNNPNQPALVAFNATMIEVDFLQHTLSIASDQPNAALQVLNSSHISFLNGTIDGSAATTSLRVGLLATEFTKLALRNITFRDLTNGVFGNSDEQGQLATNKDLLIQQCVFTMESDGQEGIVFGSLQDATVEDCAFFGGSRGINLFNNYADITIHSCSFTNHTARGVALSSIDGIAGFFFKFPSANCLISECSFSNIPLLVNIINGSMTRVRSCTGSITSNGFGINIFGFGSNPTPRGLSIEDCAFSGGGSGSAFIALGARSAAARVFDVQLRNSTFSMTGPTPALHWDILAEQVQGLTVKHCVFDGQTTGRDETGCPLEINGCPIKAANIQLGLPPGDTDANDPLIADVTIADSILTGPAQVGVYSDVGAYQERNRRISVDACTITAQEAGIQFNHTTSSEIVRASVHDVRGNEFASGVGILLAGATTCNDEASSPANAVCKNIVSNNDNGIVILSPDVVVAHNKICANTSCQLMVDNASCSCANVVCGPERTCCLEDKQCWHTMKPAPIVQRDEPPLRPGSAPVYRPDQ